MCCTDSHAVYAFSITCTCCANFSKISWGERVEFIQSDKVRSVKSEFRKFSGCSNTICHRREHVNVTGKDKDLSPLRMHVAKGQVAPKWDPLHTAYPNPTPGLGLPFFLHVSPVKCSGGERRQDGGGSFNKTTQPKTSWIFVPNLLIFRQRSGSLDSIEWSGWSARPLGLRVGIPRAGHWKECWSLFAVELFNLIAKRKALNGSKSRWAHPDD